MDITKELNDIIIKYNLDSYYPRFRKRVYAEGLLRELFINNERHEDKVLMIASNQADVDHVKHLLQGRPNYFFFLFKGNTGELRNDILNGKYSKFYLISLHNELQIAKFFLEIHIHLESIYDYFESRGIIFEDEYYRFNLEEDNFEDSFPGKNGWRNNVLLEIYVQQQKFNIVHSNKVIILKKLFFLTIYIKNFILAKNYLEKLEEMEICNNSLLAWKEVQELLLKISNNLKLRKQKDIVITWMDALSYGDGESMIYLQEKISKGISFDNAFTVMPFTRATLKTILCGKMPIDDELYKINELNEDNSHLIKFLYKKGYKVKFVSGYMNFIDIKMKSDDYHELYSSCSEIFWDVQRNIILSEKPIFVIAHALVETHHPYLSTKMEGMGFPDDGKRYELGKIELDEQMKFYMNNFSENTTYIFMSDHGQPEFKRRFHTYLIINSKNIESKRSDKLFSYVDFWILIKQIVEKGEVDFKAFNREYLIVQDFDWYSAKLIGRIIKNKEPLNLFTFGYRGIITKEHIYLRFGIGKEWLVKRGEILYEPHLLYNVNDLCDLDYLEKYRTLVGKNPQEIYLEERFKYSKYLYRLYERFLKHKDEIGELINNLFNGFSINSVAIRMGGDHSAELYYWLSDDNKRKINCIIDNNRNCVCSKLGYPIISYEEFMNKQDIGVVVLSSFKYLELLKEEAKDYHNNVQVFDIYEYLSHNAKECKDNFYLIKMQDEDYEVGFPFSN